MSVLFLEGIGTQTPAEGTGAFCHSSYELFVLYWQGPFCISQGILVI